MRTTLTLDDDVAAALERLRQTRNATLKELVNQALREGLKQMRRPVRDKEPFRTQPMDLGPPLMSSVDNIAEVLAVIEGERFK